MRGMSSIGILCFRSSIESKNISRQKLGDSTSNSSTTLVTGMVRPVTSSNHLEVGLLMLMIRGTRYMSHLVLEHYVALLYFRQRNDSSTVKHKVHYIIFVTFTS